MIRLGFLGVGWIGRNRMEVMLGTGKGEAIAICDPGDEMAREAKALAPDAALVGSLEEMLAMKPDGVVIATPSALHAEQSIQALDAGAAVFCQKPLGRTGEEVEAVLEAARRSDRLLGVDLSYRHTAAMQAIRELVHNGALGKPFAADLTFHNAYGPGNAWFYDARLSGGGCLMDLGVHLVDLALWMFDFPDVVDAQARLLKDGSVAGANEVEDFAVGELLLANGVIVRLACSWNLSAGRDAEIRASFYGTEGGAEMRNENGSFFNFVADRFAGRDRNRIAGYPDEWSGRAAIEWLERLWAGERVEGTTPGLLQTATTLDRLYGR